MVQGCQLAAERGSIWVFSELWGPQTVEALLSYLEVLRLFSRSVSEDAPYRPALVASG